MTERQRDEARGAVFRLRDAVDLAVQAHQKQDLRKVAPVGDDWKDMIMVLNLIARLAIKDSAATFA